MIDGSVHLINWSGSRRPKNIRIRIRNTGLMSIGPSNAFNYVIRFPDCFSVFSYNKQYFTGTESVCWWAAWAILELFWFIILGNLLYSSLLTPAPPPPPDLNSETFRCFLSPGPEFGIFFFESRIRPIFLRTWSNKKMHRIFFFLFSVQKWLLYRFNVVTTSSKILWHNCSCRVDSLFQDERDTW